MSNIGQLIARLRKEAGYTQKSLAEALHITDKAVSKWERGLCQPDSALLPKLSVLLKVDVEHLMSGQEHDDWVGLLDLRDGEIDLSQMVFDKPVAYYLLSHFLLLDISTIYVKAGKKNERYLSDPLFCGFGFRFIFEFEEISGHNVMALKRPLFLFGADLTRQCRSAMAASHAVKLVPTKQEATFAFLPARIGSIRPEQLNTLFENAAEKTLGRGVLSIELRQQENLQDAADFVRLHQANTGLPVGCLEEIACRKGLISPEKALEISKNSPYFPMLAELLAEQ